MIMGWFCILAFTLSGHAYCTWDISGLSISSAYGPSNYLVDLIASCSMRSIFGMPLYLVLTLHCPPDEHHMYFAWRHGYFNRYTGDIPLALTLRYAIAAAFT